MSAGAQEVNAPLPENTPFHLFPAPWLDPNTPPPPPPAPSPRSKVVQSVGAIDTSNRAAVVAAYNSYYNVAMPAPGFTGSTAGCSPGAISLAFQEWTITRINFLRAMAGVPGDTTLDSSLNGQEQAAALIMSANNSLNHAPPSGATCWTQAGYNGASSSNLAMGVTDALALYMSDPGAGNQVAGHRRWILHSRKDSFGMGQVTDGPNTNALYTFQSGVAVLVPNGIPWPPRGYVPMALFPTTFTTTQRWSFGLPNANFGAAVVTVTRNGSPVTVNVVSRTDNGYGDNTLVWEMPNGHTVVKDTTYNVSITGVTGVSPTSYNYQILPFDPADNPTANLSVSQSAPSLGVAARDVVYAVTVSNAGPSPATAVTLTDTLPPEVTFIWASPGCTRAGGTVTCNVGTLAAGASRQLKVVVRPTSSIPRMNTVSVSAATADPVPANNSNTHSMAVTLSIASDPVFRYRLYSPVTLEHHFTTDLNEYNVLGSQVGTWVQEGTVGKVLNYPGIFNGVATVPNYRLYNTTTRWHHWTTDANEYYTLGEYPDWNLEGVDGFILPTATAGTTQLYRLNYPYRPGLHHWTIDFFEYNALVTSYGWVGEGGSGFVIQ